VGAETENAPEEKHCSHQVYSVVEKMLNVNFMLAGSLRVCYRDMHAVQIVLHDMLWSHNI